MPPPNITGQLHLGHALFLTLQDIQTRARTIMGQETLWLPGTDYAGLATHEKIKEELLKHGKKEQDLEAYWEMAWKWKATYHTRITTQMKAMGAGCDWNHERFTLDKPYQQSTLYAFKCLLEKYPTLLYRKEEQWYFNMEPLAKPLIEALEKGEIQITPDGPKQELIQMLKKIEPWCLSRQIPWGLSMPLHWKEENQGSIIWKYEEGPKQEGWKKEESTFDTWFLSSLWPMASLGWPNKTDLLEKFYPASWMETGEDILFFWCARMLMIGYALTGKWAFKEIFLHGLIRDKKGKKMSKSAGNGIDPLDCIQNFGCDALRWYLACNTEPGLDLKFNLEELRKEARFINKIYQSARFLAMNDAFSKTAFSKTEESSSALKGLTQEWQQLLLNNRFKEAARLLQRHYTEHFCNGFLEENKQAIREKNQDIQKECARRFKHYLCLLHPFLPFITSELHESFF